MNCPRCEGFVVDLYDHLTCLNCGWQRELNRLSPMRQHYRNGIDKTAAVVAQTGQAPKPVSDKECAVCGVDISDRNLPARFCRDCAYQQSLKLDRERAKRAREKVKRRKREAAKA